jgi:16S rRNA (guanine527-N7)-methyltransferase
LNLRALLVQGLVDINLSLDGSQIDRLLDYLALLGKWNKSYNLTAITDPEKMIYYHLLDSLAIFNWVSHSRTALDVGSGAGLPGVPLAIAMPDSRWTLLDSNGKKTRFMQQVLAICTIENAVVVKSRVEDYHAAEPFDIIVSRAFTSLGNFADSVAHLCQPETLMLAMKTGLGKEEAGNLNNVKYSMQEFALKVPGIADKRSLVSLRLN